MIQQIPIIDNNPFDTVYLDLDGVFADFDGMVFKMSGLWPHQLKKNDMWKIVNSNSNFFAELELMKDAEHLWIYMRQFMPKFLTGLPSRRSDKDQKINWVIEKFGEGWETIVIPKKEKQLHAGPNRVLIDDNHTNINEWIANGGHGILHTDVWTTIEKLEELRKGISYL